MAVSALRPGCVLTCVINSLSHGYKLCYINQVKTTGYISAHWLSRTCPVSRARGMFSSNIYICSSSVTNWHVFASQQTLENAETETVRWTNYPFLNSLHWLAQWACVTSFAPAQNGGGRRTHDCIRRHYFWPQKQVAIWMEVICYDSLQLPPAPARKRDSAARDGAMNCKIIYFKKSRQSDWYLILINDLNKFFKE